jgi:nucleotide-binding universal stress UspA family protein
MSYKTILAVIQSKTDVGRVLDAALPLCADFGAHLIGVHSEPLPVPYASPMGFPDTDFIAVGTELNKERSAEIQAIFDERVRRESTSAEWRSMENLSGDAAASSLQIARCCDLIIAQQSDPDDYSTSLANLETLLFETGRPVLFVPYAMKVQTQFERVLVAWNGTHEAARATFDALPFIKRAKQVEILCVDPRTDAFQDGVVAGAEIAEALSRHGANVTLSSERAAGAPAGQMIENRIADSDAQLLVMGAYSQSWLKQFFFGGATRTLLESMPTATLMSR